jgi:vacuolar-type H+-ATPase subunit F/Vma7
MTLCALIGDEVSAAGFRLSGVDVHVPEPGQAPSLLRRLLGESRLVLVTADVVHWIPEDLLQQAVSAGQPPVLVIPDVRGLAEPPDLALGMRRQLGMAE